MVTVSLPKKDHLHSSSFQSCVLSLGSVSIFVLPFGMEAIASSLGEAVFSSLFRSLLDLTSSARFVKFARKEKIFSELKKWEKMLLNINASIEDAEEKQITSELVKSWLTNLRDIAYDAEDIIDELATEARRRKMKEHPGASSSTRKVRRYISTCCLSFNPSTVKFSTKMESKIKMVTARLEEAVGLKNDLSLVENDRRRYEIIRERLRSSSLVDESRVYGRERDREAILDLLMNDSDEGIGDIGVISIVGMGGVGKTTLAQLVYNDVKVERFFDLRVWVSVSEEFDVVRVTSTVLQALTLESCNFKDFNLLQVTLKEKLFGKKFFVVLDDVWNENYEQWEILSRPFIAGAAGSKILVTTRNEGVASIMSNCGTYPLKELTNHDCLSLFTRHALGTLGFEEHPDLKVIGEEIVRKCKGLPLAAKTLGGLLRTKWNRDEWEDILKTKMWDLPEDKSGVLPALRLSYHHLPFHLKRCFSYCAIFPKDYEFDEDELVLLWMAEGFLHHTKGKKQMKDIGVEYFHDLRARSFFQQSTCNKMRYVMHDLINDLAQSVSRETCFNLDDLAQSVSRETCFNLDGDKLYARVEKFRHFSFLRHQYDVSKRFEILHHMKSLRTFLALPIHTLPWAANSFLSNNILQELLPRLKCLRVLSLSGYCIDELPHHIGDLIHLRYLNLSRTIIKSLPDSMGSLFNLQTLILNGCKNLITLPQAIENLINLHVLDLTDTDSLKEMPKHIGNLKNLQILSQFIVQSDGGPDIRELKGLLHLRKELSILGLENVVDTRDARGYILKDKKELDRLDLQWSLEFLDHGNGEDGMPVFNMLQPHGNLKTIRIVFYGGTTFPSWLGGSSWANIVDISLSKCRNIMSLPALGRLPSLKKLSIEGMNGIKKLDLEFFGDSLPFFKPFPVLEVLQFQNMLNWRYWYCPNKANKEDGEFPSLRELMIHNCPKLYQKLPRYLPSLVKLTIKGCPNVAYSVMSLPSLLELNIEDCNKMLSRSMVDLASLTILRIRSLSDLTCLPDGFEQFPGALKHLVLSSCTRLTSLWQNWFTSLEHLHIDSCPKLVSFSETGFLSTLRHLRLKDCPVLKDLPNWIMRHCEFTSCLLEDLEIEECPSLTCFPRGSLPSTLKSLKIQGCFVLRSLPEGLMQVDNNKITSYLENLEIIDCPSLVYFPEGKLPTSLKMLKIWDCLQLEPLPDRILPNNASLECIGIWNWSTLICLPESLHNLSCLVELNISNCQDLKYFPEIGLPLPNLRKLDIGTCANLKSLPDQMLNLTSLQYLTICDCPCLVSFPRGGLPPNLLSLEIWDCKELKEPVSKWNLHALTSLRDFSIAGGPEMVSFPDEKCLLPTTIVSIYIARLHNLESLSVGLQNLSSLEELEVVECPKLRRLPREGLPETLGRLCIRNCSLLENQCSRDKGEYWHFISRIPCVEIKATDI
ncbi:putative disease resistance RPP13-like protein 1 [Durio zibethinus]|uniref:Disease resistance RPP13-like protein 1 n=1 Tax=Durio zibethinus TaxID=66656 RepID=A0A6P6AZC9_DURZI|nr:putative disease resistance RPP13-like protein 1 [Durio zibethinus]